MDIVDFSIDDMNSGLFQEGHLIPRGNTYPCPVDLLTDSLNRRNGNRIFESHSPGCTLGEQLFIQQNNQDACQVGNALLHAGSVACFPVVYR
jgi:hypothetical protein